MCHISLFCLFGQVATFGGLLSREMSSISSGYECLMKVVSLKGFKFYRLWKFRDIDIFGRGGEQGGLYLVKPPLFHQLWS